jgi:hypothetical protein
VRQVDQSEERERWLDRMRYMRGVSVRGPTSRVQDKAAGATRHAPGCSIRSDYVVRVVVD